MKRPLITLFLAFAIGSSVPILAHAQTEPTVPVAPLYNTPATSASSLYAPVGPTRQEQALLLVLSAGLLLTGLVLVRRPALPLSAGLAPGAASAARERPAVAG